MSISAAAVLTIILARPAWVDRDISLEERSAALAPIAEAIGAESRSLEEAAELVMLGRREGESFALAIVRGGCTNSGCDHGLSRGVFQLRELACPEAYRFSAGSLESIAAEAHCAVTLFRQGAYRCRQHAITPLHGAVAWYATGHSCHWSGAGERVAQVRRIETELAKLSASEKRTRVARKDAE